MKKKNFCKICGLYSEEPPWGEDGLSPTYDYCPCCGVEFGYQDYCQESIKQYRSLWIQKGAKWDIPSRKTLDWNFQDQLRNIGVDPDKDLI